MLHPSKFGLTARRTHILRMVNKYSKCYFVLQIHIRCNRGEVHWWIGKPNLVFPFPCIVLQTSTPFTNCMSFKTVWWISCSSIIAWQVVLGGVNSINVSVLKETNVSVLKETSLWHTNKWVTLHRWSPELLVEPMNCHILDTFSPNLQPCSIHCSFQWWSCNHHCTMLFQNPRPPCSSDLALRVHFLWVKHQTSKFILD